MKKFNYETFENKKKFEETFFWLRGDLTLDDML